MSEESQSSAVNTVLIVLLIIVVLVLGFYFFRAPAADAPNDPGVQVDFNLPGASGESEAQ